MIIRQRLKGSFGGLVRDTGWTGASEIVNLVTGFVVLNVLIRTLGPVGYGRYVAIAALSAILVTLSSTWVVMVLLQQGIQEHQPLRAAHAQAAGMASSAAAAVFALGVVLSPVLLPDLPVRVAATFIAGELLAGVLIAVSSAAVQIADGLPAAIKLRLIQSVARFAVILALALLGAFRLDVLANALFVTYVVLGLTIYTMTVRRLGLSFWPQRPVRKGMRDGYPYAGVLVASAMQEDADKILLVRFADSVDAGLYAAAYRIVQLGFLPIRALIGAAHPRFLVNTPGMVNEHLDRAVRFTKPAMLYGAVATIGIMVTAPVVPAFFGTEYDGTLPLLLALAPLVLLRSASLFPLNALMGLSRYGTRFAVVAAAAALNIGLNLVLIPPLSVWGAVIATAVTEVTVITLVWAGVIRAQRQHNLGAPVPAAADPLG